MNLDKSPEKRREIRVLLGNFEETISDILCRYMKSAFQDDCEMLFRISYKSEEILEIIDTEKIDMYILIMNNIMYSSVNSTGDRINNWIKILHQMKKLSNKPIIALSGWDLNPSELDRITEIAEYYLPLPIELKELQDRMRKCLR